MEEYKRNCPKCGKLKVYKTRNGWKFAVSENRLCMKCTKTGIRYSDEVNKKKGRIGKENPFYGKTHSMESRKKMSESLLSKDSNYMKWVNSDDAIEFYKTHSKNMSSMNNPFYGKTHTKEAREKMSIIRTHQIANGEFNVLKNSNGNKGFYTSNKTNKTEFYDSELELVRMMMLDDDISVINWTKEHSIIIPYEYKGITKNYVPDFLITYTNGGVVIEETKGYDPKAKLKKEALKKYCKDNEFTYNWIEQNELKEYKEWRKRN